MGVKTDTGGGSEEDEEGDPGDEKLDCLLDDNMMELQNNSQEGSTKGWLDKLTGAQKRSLGIPMALTAGK
jgi:hypothetical protein